jgi:hypothetical protein
MLTRRQRLSIALDPWIYPMQRWYRDIPMKIAWLLPRSVALWAFIRVYACDGNGPGPEYSQKYQAWERGAGR